MHIILVAIPYSHTAYSANTNTI